jgi:hypothetical protein
MRECAEVLAFYASHRSTNTLHCGDFCGDRRWEMMVIQGVSIQLLSLSDSRKQGLYGL